MSGKIKTRVMVYFEESWKRSLPFPGEAGVLSGCAKAFGYCREFEFGSLPRKNDKIKLNIGHREYNTLVYEVQFTDGSPMVKVQFLEWPATNTSDLIALLKENNWQLYKKIEKSQEEIEADYKKKVIDFVGSI